MIVCNSPCQQFSVASFHLRRVGEAAYEGLVFAVGQDAVAFFT